MEVEPFLKMGGRKGAGTIAATLSNAETREVWLAFADGCLSCYGMDLRKGGPWVTGPIIKTCETFTKNYGKDDALRIIRQLFTFPHEGAWRGQNVGTSIFTRGWRWLADSLLAESYKGEKNAGGWRNDL